MYAHKGTRATTSASSLFRSVLFAFFASTHCAIALAVKGCDAVEVAGVGVLGEDDEASWSQGHFAHRLRGRQHAHL